MIKISIISLLITLFSHSIRAQSNNFIDGQLLVMLDKAVSVSKFVQLKNEKFPQLSFTLKESISELMNVWLLEFNSTYITNDKLINQLNRDPKVLLVQNNHTNIQSRDTCVNDTFFLQRQWQMDNRGQTGGTVGADIQACDAWDLYPSDSLRDSTVLGNEIVIAVIEDGFDLYNKDINYFINSAEVPFDGIDNDSNGYIDDTLGWNTYQDTNRITIAGHGSHVTGVAASKGNNTIGITGVAGGVTVLPVQGSSVNEAIVLKSYGYVLAMRDLYNKSNGLKGAFVVATNSSFGVDNGNPASYPLWCAFYDSLGSRGILNVAATSNSNVNVDQVGDIPTTCNSPYLLTINNTNANDNHYPSGTGAVNIDMGAPGVGVYGPTINGFYGYKTGTSISTPMVTGSVAFMFAVACENFLNEYAINPDSVILLVKETLMAKGDPIADLNGITVAGTRLNLYQSALEIKNEGLCEVVGLKEETRTENGFILFPNPSSGRINLKFNNEFNEKVTISIFNSVGKLVHKQLSNKSDINDIFIQQKGVYLLRAESLAGKQFSRTFIIK